MKTFRSQRGPFVEQPFFSDAEIEAICLDELRKQSLLPDKPEPIRIERFAEKRFKVSVESRDLGEGVLGLTEFGPSGVTGIYISEALDAEKTRTSERRVRSTIAHEVGHGLLHTFLFVLSSNTTPLFGDLSDPKAPKVLCREGNIDTGNKAYGGEWWEFQANAIMGHLLVPRPLLANAIEPFLIPSGNLGGKKIDPDRYEVAVRSIADTFDVNPAVARIRLEMYYPIQKTKQLML
jgi:hypothetical protein